MSLKETQQNLKRMLRKSLASNASDAISKNGDFP